MQNTPTEQAASLSWSVLQRLRFIDFRLCWEGRINRGDLVDAFGVSVPQASNDLRRYLERAPGNMEYDKSQKSYFPSLAFKPVFIESTAESYFDQLTISRPGVSDGCGDGLIKCAPSFDVLPAPERRADFLSVRKIVHAINSKAALEIKYQSISTDLSGWRWIEPHALASDGLRWHVRAYCQKRSQFRDFVLGRILDIRGSRASETSATGDTEWNEYVRVVIAANPRLASGQRSIIERDYAMKGGRAEIIIRRALLFYMKRRLGADDLAEKSPNEQQVVIVDVTFIA